MSGPRLRFHHLGVPTHAPRDGESYLPEYGVHVTSHKENPFGIQWMRYEPGSPLPDLVKNMPHLAFQVEDLDAALEGYELLIPSNSPSDGVRVAFIVHDGVPVEFLEFDGDSGMGEREARRKALLDFGGLDRFEEQTRDARPTRTLENLGSDFRQAIRRLTMAPGSPPEFNSGIGTGVRCSECMDHGERTPLTEITIRTLRPADWPEVREIYDDGIASGNATFETKAPAWEEWDTKQIQACRLVAEEGGKVQGWAALWPASDRCVYGGVAEVSVYVGRETQGKGVGSRLLQELVTASEKEGFWTLQAGIFPENESSVRIHEKCGFRVIGHRERLGKMNDTWRDVLLMERRSPTVGI